MTTRCAAGRGTLPRRIVRGGAYLTTLVAGACHGPLPQSAMAPAGSDARHILQMHWVLVTIASLVSIVIIAATVIALVRRRHARGSPPPLPLAPSVFEEREKTEQRSGEHAPPELGAGFDEPFSDVELDAPERDRDALRWVLGGGVVFPAVVLIGLFFYVMVILAEVDRPAPADSLTVEVIGWQYWWEVHYYDGAGEHLLETANEIHIPADAPVRVRLRAADVIHSFWIPRLAGKLDMIPGRTNEFSIQADSPGTYRGQCAEYCGLQHAKMSMLIIAQPPDEFAAWVAAQSSDAPVPADSITQRGRELFLTTACAACHAIRGTPATGEIGPDLTHVASRRTLAALAIPNTRGHMGGWLVNPQAIKPGANMPSVPLERGDFEAMLEYMMSLR
jgi:cytochrome c oxidase subunit 2